MPTSVLTLVHRRRQHLNHLIAGLSRSTLVPDELVIVYMNEPEPYSLPPTPFLVRSVHVNSSATRIPLARARNAAVAHARHDWLVFLDVDCIPEHNMLTKYEEAAARFSGLMMGEVFYLPPGATEGNWTFASLAAAAVRHPHRPVVEELVQPEPRYELFWSLHFALSRATFQQLSGFDERYRGYGGEDTDVAFTARAQAIPFALCTARAYHQHHPVYRPPLQHFDDIVANARCFYQKWQRWPMEGWLRAFQERDLIRWDEERAILDVVRPPTEEEVAQAYHKAPAGF